MSLDFLNDKQHFSKNQPPSEKKFLAAYLSKKMYDKILSHYLQPVEGGKQTKEILQ